MLELRRLFKMFTTTRLKSVGGRGLRNLAFILLLSLDSAGAEDLHLDLTYDTSLINTSVATEYASRGLLSFSYENNFKWGGGELIPLLSYSVLRGANGSDLAMDLQGFSNIDNQAFSQWQEVGLQWTTEDTYIRIGKLDANANFSSIDRAGDFINASFGLTPTAYPLPTYPEIEPGFYLQHRFTKALQTGIGYYLPDELNADIGNSTPLWLLDNCWYCNERFRFVTGYWQLNFRRIDRVNGQFIFVEGRIDNNLDGFILFSKNDGSQPDQIDKHLKFGLTYNAPFSMENHKIGLGVSKIFGFQNERAIELFYQFPIMGQFELKPDIQYISNAAPEQDTIIFSLRTVWHIR